MVFLIKGLQIEVVVLALSVAFLTVAMTFLVVWHMLFRSNCISGVKACFWVVYKIWRGHKFCQCPFRFYKSPKETILEQRCTLTLCHMLTWCLKITFCKSQPIRNEQNHNSFTYKSLYTALYHIYLQLTINIVA